MRNVLTPDPAPIGPLRCSVRERLVRRVGRAALLVLCGGKTDEFYRAFTEFIRHRGHVVEAKWRNRR